MLYAIKYQRPSTFDLHGVMIPCLHPVRGILVDSILKQEVQKPDMLWNGCIEVAMGLQLDEEVLPLLAKA